MNLALPHGTILDDFQVHDELNRGGFSIIYEGSNRESKTPVAIKEYLPDGLATRDAGGRYIQVVPKKERDFQEGLEDFLNEANILEQLSGHDNIVRFYKKIEMHNTAYIVMELVGGKDLSTHLKDEGGILGENELKAILYPLLNALEAVHKAGYLHRDIKPGNIVLRREDRSPVLLDFGAAQKKGMNQKVMVTDPYSPPEQYAERKQDPSTDIYALGAVCFQALMGTLPEAGNQREQGHDMLHDMFYVEGGSEEFHKAIDKALKIEPSERPQNVKEWKKMMEQLPPKPDPVPPTKLLDQPVPPNPLTLFDRLTKCLSKLSDRLIVGGIILCLVLIIGITYWDNIDWEEPPPSPPPPPGYEALTKKEAELKEFERVVRRGPGWNRTFKGEPDLHIAARLGLPEIIKDLLEKGADIRSTDNDGQTPLHVAARAKAAAAVSVLVNEEDVDVNATDNDGQTPLHVAAEVKDSEVVRRLLKEGKADVGPKDNTGWTPLHVAAKVNTSEVVKELLDGNADVNAKSNAGETPLHFAVRFGSPEVVKLLLDGNADADAKEGYHGETPLHMVMSRYHDEWIKGVLEEKYKGGWPPAYSIADVLLRGGADVNAKSNTDWTPLHYAAHFGFPDMVKLLLDGNADVDAKNNDGKMPEDMDIPNSVRTIFDFHRIKINKMR